MRHIRTIVLSVISLFICTALYAQPRAIDRIVGMIGNEVVLYSDIQGQKLDMIQNKIPVSENTECILYENFMFNALLLHQAKIDSIEPNEEQIDAELNAKMDYYRQLLEQYGQTFQSAYGKSELEWKEEIRVVMMKRSRIDQMQAKITQGVSITPREVRNYFNNLPADSVPLINSHIEYAEIVISPKVSKEAEELEIRKLKKWREDVIAGRETFEFYATIYSDDPGSASEGGDFDCVSKGMFVPEFDAAAMNMEEGTISEPFKTEFGWHILKLRARRGSSYCGSHILRIPKITPSNKLQAKRTLDSLAKEIALGKLDFCVAAKDFSESEETKYNCGKVLNPRTGSTMWDVSDLDRETAVMLNNLEVGEVTAPFVFMDRRGRESYKIVMLVNRTQPHKANLNQDYERLQNDALNKKKQEALNKWIARNISSSHTWVSDDFKSCPLEYGWSKAAN